MMMFRELIKNYMRKLLKGAIIASITFVASCILFGIMTLPGVVIAYIVGYTDLKVAAGMSLWTVGIIAMIVTGICKVYKDYQKLKREDSKD